MGVPLVDVKACSRRVPWPALARADPQFVVLLCLLAPDLAPARAAIPLLRQRTRDWRNYPELDRQEARGHAAFAIYNILTDTLLAIRATARNDARYERISQHCRREQHRQAPPPSP
ncbi:hypothetical protein JCM8097_008689 [Rhodosporidiobolus ruineniae]